MHIEPPRGAGRGAITQDGCAVELYLEMPYRGELELLAAHLPPGCPVLELGCGAGRLTRPLLDKGHAVTAVDNSPDMLQHVPGAAEKVCGDIERLELGRTFDAVLLASNLINVADDAGRRALLDACRRHLSPRGVLLFQRFDAAWMREVEPGSLPSKSGMDIAIDRVERAGSLIRMSIRYRTARGEWAHHFTARLLDDADIEVALREAGFGAPGWIDARWAAARPL
jgi:SAM-dependent methyltransferase